MIIFLRQKNDYEGTSSFYNRSGGDRIKCELVGVRSLFLTPTLRLYRRETHRGSNRYPTTAIITETEGSAVIIYYILYSSQHKKECLISEAPC